MSILHGCLRWPSRYLSQDMDVTALQRIVPGTIGLQLMDDLDYCSFSTKHSEKQLQSGFLKYVGTNHFEIGLEPRLFKEGVHRILVIQSDSPMLRCLPQEVWKYPRTLAYDADAWEATMFFFVLRRTLWLAMILEYFGELINVQALDHPP